MPSTNKAAKAVFDSGRTMSYHIKTIVDCQQSSKSPHIFKLVLNRAGGDKRYYFEAETPKLAGTLRLSGFHADMLYLNCDLTFQMSFVTDAFVLGEIVQNVKNLKTSLERSSTISKSRMSRHVS
jgi:target of rapamycin complex 2 subunit MAPKAP1